MKKCILGSLLASSLLLGTCSINIEDGSKKQNQDKQNSEQHTSNNKQSKQVQNSSQNTQSQYQSQEALNEEQNNADMTEDEAIQKATNVFNSGVYHDFKIDSNRSTNSKYFITFLTNDAVGTPQSSATTVDKKTGEVGNFIDDRSKEEIENYIEFTRKSHKYQGPSDKFEKIVRENHTRPNDDVMNQKNQ